MGGGNQPQARSLTLQQLVTKHGGFKVIKSKQEHFDKTGKRMDKKAPVQYPINTKGQPEVISDIGKKRDGA